MFGVGDGVSNDVLEERSEDVSGLLIDEGRDSLDSSSSCQSSDCWLGDSKDGLLKGFLGVPLGANLSESLSFFSASRRVGDEVR